MVGKTGAACEKLRRGARAMTDPDHPREPLTPNWVHVLRTAQMIHLQLSQMADQKASILMGATFVIFTLVLGQARGGMPPLPLAILGGFALLSAVFAVMVVMPAIGGGSGPKPPLNLLFFGSFTQLSEADFVEGLRARLGEDHRALELMARDLYQNGQILSRKKYRLLGWAYRVLLLGLVASFVALLWQAAVAALV